MPAQFAQGLLFFCSVSLTAHANNTKQAKHLANKALKVCTLPTRCASIAASPTTCNAACIQASHMVTCRTGSLPASNTRMTSPDEYWRAWLRLPALAPSPFGLCRYSSLLPADLSRLYSDTAKPLEGMLYIHCCTGM
jgi:hypothetical protein